MHGNPLSECIYYTESTYEKNSNVQIYPWWTLADCKEYYCDFEMIIGAKEWLGKVNLLASKNYNKKILDIQIT